jgi:hypothetical protein
VLTKFGAFLRSVCENRKATPRISFAVPFISGSCFGSLVEADCAVGEALLVSPHPSRRVRDEYQEERLHIVISPLPTASSGRRGEGGLAERKGVESGG